MNLTFGPVLSRRFGLSLGIDLSPNAKQCNFDCLFCELKGAKVVESIQNPPLVKDVVEAVKAALLKHENIDVITLTANGEPTLYPHLKELVFELNKIKKDKKLLILSNGSNICKDEVQTALLDIDIVKLSLDSVNPLTFKKIDRPAKSVDLLKIIEGMKNFRKIFKNELVLEVLVVENLNDTRDEFLALNEVINEIKPSRVDISTIDRPSAYRVKPVSYEVLKALSKNIQNIPVVIAKRVESLRAKTSLSIDEILSLLDKRPQSKEDMKMLFDEATNELLHKLEKEGKIKLVNVANVEFYKLA
ncbi:MAG: radical SAM protein [Campylobacteraceae bacterium]